MSEQQNRDELINQTHEALDDAPVMNAAEVIAYLQNHPEFFVEHAEALAGLPLPTTRDGNVVSMAHWQNNMLREKAEQHQVRLERLLAQAASNQQNHDKLLHLVSNWLGLVDANDLPAQIERDVQDAFHLDAVQVMVWNEPSRAVYHPSGQSWSDNVVIFANSLRTPYCGPCKGFEIEAALAKKSASGSIASLAIVPLWGTLNRAHVCVGVLLLGAADAKRFTPDMGTHFLQSIAHLAGAALSRVQSPVHLSLKT
ncbi:hypothetical protein GCM10009007_08830 [Formosimonas limnophila]|uniref:DUF484 family protein n=1 Tax=Formosimonas limnophila TaxID=1384487 RepID=A0A8J3FZN5_9BURK|nr:DUF484 family protein [Formosimonas limnophila]GHA70346.1 hypothetical protein GCM10009007_08830 [Formosimonas limnophila]